MLAAATAPPAASPFVGFTGFPVSAPSIAPWRRLRAHPVPACRLLPTATRDRRPIFEISRVADLFVDTLLHYRTLGHYKLHAYVVMPDHVQLILTPQSITLDQAVGLIKNGFAYRLDTELPIWEDGFTGYSVANMHDLEAVRAYLHQLPVRANMAPAAELYPHSSAYRQTPPNPCERPANLPDAEVSRPVNRRPPAQLLSAKPRPNREQFEKENEV
jgi:putative transposase